MRHHALISRYLFLAAVGGCSLNPQPLPPDQATDGGTVTLAPGRDSGHRANVDSGTNGRGSGTGGGETPADAGAGEGFTDGGFAADASIDAGPPDGAVDAGARDASTRDGARPAASHDAAVDGVD